MRFAAEIRMLTDSSTQDQYNVENFVQVVDNIKKQQFSFSSYVFTPVGREREITPYIFHTVLS